MARKSFGVLLICVIGLLSLSNASDTFNSIESTTVFPPEYDMYSSFF